jgi:hypothetical protein
MAPRMVKNLISVGTGYLVMGVEVEAVVATLALKILAAIGRVFWSCQGALMVPSRLQVDQCRAQSMWLLSQVAVLACLFLLEGNSP